MDAKKRLIRFMEKKDEILKRNGATIPYFTPDDACSIMQWLDDEAEVVLSQIDLNSYNDVWSCPFCIYHGKHCDSCRYGKHHGICLYNSSTYRLVQQQCNIKPKGLQSILKNHANELKAILEDANDKEKSVA